jgi:hypothetical protein
LACRDPEAFLAQVDDLVAARLGPGRAEVWVVDYQMQTLARLDDPGGALAGVEDTSAGRAFATGRLIGVTRGDHTTSYVPIRVCGERLGVLVTTTPAPLGDAGGAYLGEVASLVGQALKVGGHHTDWFRLAQRRQRLSLAAELQWQLLPGWATTGAGFSVAGQLEPAYQVAGDAFDWDVGSATLALQVADGMGRGVEASLLTTLAVTALRNARRSGLPLADQASLADQALYAHFGGEQFVSALLFEVDLATGATRMVDAGSPQVLRQRGDHLQVVDLDPQLPLGMFDRSVYEEQHLSLHPGERLVITSDGAQNVVSPTGVAFGDHALSAALAPTFDLPAEEVVRHLIGATMAHAGGQDLRDDALVVCLDWRGR